MGGHLKTAEPLPVYHMYAILSCNYFLYMDSDLKHKEFVLGYYKEPVIFH